MSTTVPETLPAVDENWWRQAAVYQIYPRSFADSNGDGIGDLPGITSRVPYLKELGVDAVWLSPFYPSALADGGYDVDDYRNVDPRLGTLEDFDEMASALHDAGIRLIVDIVPNHSSDRHEWFREALASPPGSPARERYIFRDGKGKNGEVPPSDWDSVFGGPAWERVTEADGTPGQWYFHLFAKEQPDFNWDNPEIREDFLKTLRFWSDRGVDGFRVDVAHGMAKDFSEPMPSKAELQALNTGTDGFVDGSHPFWDRDAVHEIYAEWRKVFNEYTPARTAVAEAWVHPDRRARYASPEGLGQAFNFDLLQADFDAEEFRTIITKNLAEAAASGASSTWVFSNHDVIRHATRYGLPAAGPAEAGTIMANSGKSWLLDGGDPAEVDAELGLRRARAATQLMLALPGSSYLYQGEELGLQEAGQIPDSQRQDPSFFRNPGVEIGRDGCRVPLPWSAEGASFGFGTGGSHLPQPEWFAGFAVSEQEDTPDSTLSFYRQALALRGELQGAEELEWLPSTDDSVLAFRRPGGWISVTNFGKASVELPEGEVLLSSAPLEGRTLPDATTAWLRG
ncbi:MULTISPECIES: glycoside hydrolase family 13 protein [Arthrobacter]|uniref:Glycoside hydrolase family 13 protein n=2 Tax=Arthrobacter TaxID=1663 RepID=A0ABU9KQG3_9MICC|nr:glycoside hydrolase family 13 protein [Arthrobacter sp. YJM1]MDP5228568.1 glycoside hydrolase family 13 protein [Arthrobacter sp. YJM1]